jgi:hypothetical protein
MARKSTTNILARASMALLLAVIAGGFIFSSDSFTTTAFSQARRRPARATPQPRRYSEFPHALKAHQLECASCHKFPSSNWNRVRTGAAAFPDITDYPKHESCLGCHRQQFFRGTPPLICSICHTRPGPQGSARHPFPNPREIFDRSTKGRTAASDFQVSFSHEKHVDIVTASGAARAVRSPFRHASFTPAHAPAEESCAVCHQTLNPQGSSGDEFLTKPPGSLGDAFWLKKGTFKSVPIGHTTCFTCHSQDSGIAPTPTDCATCHKLKQALAPGDFDLTIAKRIGVSDRVTLDAWKRRDSSGTFRHEFSSHSDLSCDTCHNVQTMNTLDAKTKKVMITSCSMCHVTATVDDGGALNVEVQSRKANPAFQCTKCHIVFGKQPLPQSHVQAIVEAGGKP